MWVFGLSNDQQLKWMLPRSKWTAAASKQINGVEATEHAISVAVDQFELFDKDAKTGRRGTLTHATNLFYREQTASYNDHTLRPVGKYREMDPIKETPTPTPPPGDSTIESVEIEEVEMQSVGAPVVRVKEEDADN